MCIRHFQVCKGSKYICLFKIGNPMVRAEFLLDGYAGKQDEDIRFRSSGEGGSSEGREAKERAAWRLGVRLHVEVVFEDASKLAGRKRGGKGWFDPTA